MEDYVTDTDESPTEIDPSSDTEPDSKIPAALVVAATAAIAGTAGYFVSKFVRRNKDVDLSEDESPAEDTDSTDTTTLTVVETEDPE